MRQQAEMFEGVPMGPARVSLARARELVAAVTDHLEHEDQFDYADRALRLADRARGQGAHSVARALRYSVDVMADERWNPKATDILVEHVANRWLRRQEVGR